MRRIFYYCCPIKNGIAEFQGSAADNQLSSLLFYISKPLSQKEMVPEVRRKLRKEYLPSPFPDY